MSADPGCGKSVLSSFLVEELKGTHTSATPTSTICHFFFKDDSDAQSSASNALSAILHQLCDAKKQLIQYPLKEYSKKKDKFVTEVATLWTLIVSATAQKDCGTVICIIDGLDECQADSRKLLLDALVGFYSAQLQDQVQPENRQLKLLVTSRPYPEIERCFRKLPTVRLRAEKETAAISEDIARVVRARVEAIGENKRLTPARISELCHRLTNNADRTFLWVSLILGMIEESARASQSALDDMITQIPSSLDAIYAKILAHSTDAIYAKKLLHIIVAAVEPMSPQQLNIALCIDEHHSSSAGLEDDLEPDFETTMKALCGLFIRVIYGRVYLVHQTAREYLMEPAGELLAKPVPEAPSHSERWKHSLDTLQSNRILAHSCVWYLRIFALPGKGVLDESLIKNRNGPTVTGRGSSSHVTAYVLDTSQKEEEDERWERRMGYRKNHWDSSSEDEDQPRVRKVNLAYEKAIRRGEVDEDGYYSSEPGSPIINSWDRMDPQIALDSFMPYAGAWWHIHLRESNIEPHEPLCRDVSLLCELDSGFFDIWTPIFRTT